MNCPDCGYNDLEYYIRAGNNLVLHCKKCRNEYCEEYVLEINQNHIESQKLDHLRYPHKCKERA